MRTKRGRARGKVICAARPASPPPGCYCVMQKHGGDVLQWAWTCPSCGTTEYVLGEPPAEVSMLDRLESGYIRQRCGTLGCPSAGKSFGALGTVKLTRG